MNTTLNQVSANPAEFEKGFETGYRDGYNEAAAEAIPVLELALARLDISDCEGEEQEHMAAIRAVLDQFRQFVPA